ncbi:MAG TPA: hypothetical protein VGR35_00340 [Tepidisphaeraceae bacterium]|nr:hypothetical protein [Tepidisphaeraceae bacterium]
MPRLGKRKRREREVKPQKLCVYCFQRPAVKMDHVVGKVFFDELPQQMIIVPSCHECDSGTGDGGERDLHLDEEYMRNVLCMRHDTASLNPIAKRLSQSQVIRSFDKSPLLARSVFSTWEPLHIWSPVYSLPTDRYLFTVRHVRTDRVIRKITRGLYYHRERQPLPADSVINVIGNLTEEQVDMFLPMFVEPYWFGMEQHVFAFKQAHFPDRRDHVLTLMVLYQSFAAVSVTMSPQDAERWSQNRDEQQAADDGSL